MDIDLSTAKAALLRYRARLTQVEEQHQQLTHEKLELLYVIDLLEQHIASLEQGTNQKKIKVSTKKPTPAENTLEKNREKSRGKQKFSGYVTRFYNAVLTAKQFPSTKEEGLILSFGSDWRNFKVTITHGFSNTPSLTLGEEIDRGDKSFILNEIKEAISLFEQIKKGALEISKSSPVYSMYTMHNVGSRLKKIAPIVQNW